MISVNLPAVAEAGPVSLEFRQYQGEVFPTWSVYKLSWALLIYSSFSYLFSRSQPHLEGRLTEGRSWIVSFIFFIGVYFCAIFRVCMVSEGFRVLDTSLILKVPFSSYSWPWKSVVVFKLGTALESLDCGEGCGSNCVSGVCDTQVWKIQLFLTYPCCWVCVCSMSCFNPVIHAVFRSGKTTVCCSCWSLFLFNV